MWFAIVIVYKYFYAITPKVRILLELYTLFIAGLFYLSLFLEFKRLTNVV